MPLPAITYAIVTIGLIMITISLVYMLVLPKLSSSAHVLTVNYILDIENYAIVKVSSNTRVTVFNNFNEPCTTLYNNTFTVYIVCDCSNVNGNVPIIVTICAASSCKSLIIRCPR